jgi:hypothetical protein
MAAQEKPLTADQSKSVIELSDPPPEKSSAKKWEVLSTEPDAPSKKKWEAVSTEPVVDTEVKPGMADYAKEGARQVGLTARYGIEGLASPFATVANIPAAASNAVLGTKLPEQNAALSNLLTQIGLPSPKGSTERVVGDLSRALSSAAGGIGTAKAIGTAATSPVTKNVMQTLADNPKAQALATVAGTGAGEAAKGLGAPSWAQFLATLGGGILPTGIASLPSAFRGAVARGRKSPQEIQETIDSFRNVGTTPTLGQATQNPYVQAAENIVGKTPGGSPISRKANEQQQAIGNKVDEMANNLSKNASAESAGRAIQKGIKTEISDKQATQSNLYNQMDQYLPANTGVQLTNTMSTLDRLAGVVTGAEKTSSALVNPKIRKIYDGIKADLSKVTNDPNFVMGAQGRSSLPFSALKDLRSSVGRLLENSALVSDIPTAELKQIYGAISEDMRAAAKANGPEAEKAFNRANNYTKALHDRLDVIQNVVDKNGGPEKIFQAAISGTGEGATTFRAVMKSLPKEEQKTLVSTVLRRLGRSPPGRQDDVGSVFSTETFLTNWNKLSPEAKSTMTGAIGKQFKKDLDDVAKIAANLREGSSVYANPSGTASAVAAMGTYGALGSSLATGNIGTAGALLGGLASNRGAGKLLTNPDFVHWVVTTPARPAQIPEHLARLSVIAASNADDREAIQDYQAEMEKKHGTLKSDKSSGKMPWQKTSLDNVLGQ